VVEPALQFPSDTYFSCTDCGKCCNTPWRIKVDTKKADTIRDTSIYQRLTREGYQPLKVMDDEFELDRAEDGRCHFLQNDLCGIHSEKGPSAKPSVCQLYPFSLVSTPDGYYVSLAFTCPAVISGSGPPVHSHDESLRKTVLESPHFFPPGLEPGRSVTLTSQQKTQWDQYVAFESKLLDAIDQTHDCVETLLHGAAALLVGSWCTEQFRTGPSEALAAALQDTLGLFVTNCIASLEEKAHPEKRAEHAASLAYGGLAFSNILGTNAPPYEQAVGGCQLTRSVLKRYVKHKIWGKILLTGPTLTVRLLMLALSLEILLYYYNAKREQHSVLHFDPTLLEWSLDLIETDFLVHHELILPLMQEWENVGSRIAVEINA
jgi:Fe-S-cluster containining protein